MKSLKFGRGNPSLPPLTRWAFSYAPTRLIGWWHNRQPMKTQEDCIWDALKYARDVEARALGYNDYEDLYTRYRYVNPVLFYDHYKAIQDKVNPLFELWLIA